MGAASLQFCSQSQHGLSDSCWWRVVRAGDVKQESLVNVCERVNRLRICMAHAQPPNAFYFLSLVGGSPGWKLLRLQMRLEEE